MRPIIIMPGITARRSHLESMIPLERNILGLCERHRIEIVPEIRKVSWSDLSDLPDRRGLLGMLIDAIDLVRDVVRYETDPELRASIWGRLATAIEAAPGCVLVLHSLAVQAAIDLLIARPELAAQVFGILSMGAPCGLTGSLLDWRSRAPVCRERLDHVVWVDVFNKAAPGDPIMTPRGILGLEGVVEGLEEAGFPCDSVGVSLDVEEAHTGYFQHIRVAAAALDLAGRP